MIKSHTAIKKGIRALKCSFCFMTNILLMTAIIIEIIKPIVLSKAQ